MQWDPTQYAQFAGQRGRPFFDLVRQIGAEAPGTVVDLGCGPGELTVTLADRWPAAHIRGIDSSTEMIDRAPRDRGVQFAIGAAASFDATGTDVLVSNAMLQWVPDHHQLLSSWAGQLNDDGWLAFQVPANFDAPSHRLMRELAESATWQTRLDNVLRHSDAVAEPDEYLDLLVSNGLQTEVWQTEYLHILQGPDPVLEWVRGTGLRPVLAALSPADAADFSAEYAALLREAYPARSYGTVFGFLRTFVVGHKTGTAA
jgi:trans-aconitate 2-methyltransferase